MVAILTDSESKSLSRRIQLSTYGETLSAGSGGLISSQNTLAWGDDGVGDAAELILQFLGVVVVVGSHLVQLEISGSA